MRERTRHGDAGEALVEFAFASVIFFVVVFGICSFGLAVFQFNLLADLAQEGARWASVRGSGHASGLASASAADVQTYVRARSLGLGTAVTVNVYTVNSSKACTTTSVNPSGLAKGAGFCVRVRTTFTPFTALIPAGPLALESTTQMVMAR